MEEILRGRVHKFGDYIECDSHIIPYHAAPDYITAAENPEKLAQLCLTPIDADFPKKVREGDFVVAGKGFGSGKTHEIGIIALEISGIKGIIAESIHRAYFRFAIDHGICPLICPHVTEQVEAGDWLEVNIRSGKITNLNTGQVFWAAPLPDLVVEILQVGGMLNLVKKRLHSAV